MDEQWQADLVDMQSFARDNKGIKFLLTVIDVLSKRAWPVPLKNKTSVEIIKAFEKNFKEGRKPEKLQIDAGSEFMNCQFQTFLKKVECVSYQYLEVQVRPDYIFYVQVILLYLQVKYLTHLPILQFLCCQRLDYQDIGK